MSADMFPGGPIGWALDWIIYIVVGIAFVVLSALTFLVFGETLFGGDLVGPFAVWMILTIFIVGKMR